MYYPRTHLLPKVLRAFALVMILAPVGFAAAEQSDPQAETENADAEDHEKGVFKSKDKYGRTIFSDRPSGEAELIELKEKGRYSAKGQYERFTPASTQKPKSFSYTKLAITSPDADEQIRDNRGNIVIGYQVQHSTPPGHKVLLQMDGEPLTAVLGSGSHSLTNIPRGTHQVALVVKNQKGVIIHISDPISFTLHRFSKMHAR